MNNTMNETKARKVHIPFISLKMVRESNQDYELSQRQIANPESAYKIFQQFGMDEEAEETMILLALDTKCKPTGLFEVSRGSLDSAIVHPREIYKRAIMANASSIILAHNHPSGDPTPSQEDIEITKRIAEAGRILGIELHDHIVIGENTYISLKEKGIF
jgi:DNA repair protein RadC